MNRTPEEVKKLVAGPLGRQMEMFPLRFCKPVYFGVPLSREHPVAVNNGTASLLDLRGDLLAVTCHHVIEGYITCEFEREHWVSNSVEPEPE